MELDQQGYQYQVIPDCDKTNPSPASRYPADDVLQGPSTPYGTYQSLQASPVSVSPKPVIDLGKYSNLESSVPSAEERESFIETYGEEPGDDPLAVSIVAPEEISRMEADNTFHWAPFFSRHAGHYVWGRRIHCFVTYLTFCLSIIFAGISKFQSPGLVVAFVLTIVTSGLATWCYLLPELFPERQIFHHPKHMMGIRRAHFYINVIILPILIMGAVSGVSQSGTSQVATSLGSSIIWVLIAIHVGFLMYQRRSLYVDHWLMEQIQAGIESDLLRTYGHHSENIADEERVFWPPFQTLSWCLYWCPDGTINNLLLTSHRVVLTRRATQYPTCGTMEYASRWIKDLDGLTITTRELCCSRDCNCFNPWCLTDLCWVWLCCLGIPSPIYVCVDRKCQCFNESVYVLPSDPNTTSHRGVDLYFPMYYATAFYIRNLFLNISDRWKRKLQTKSSSDDENPNI